ncbi:MAG: hypothetical protein ACOCZ5_01370 [bacterium]
MKIPNAPRNLQKLPKSYSLDSGNKLNIKKYRIEKAKKDRKENKKVFPYEDERI